MRIFIVTLMILISSFVYAKKIKIAVIDTGFDFQSTWADAEKQGLAVPKLCKTGHKDVIYNKKSYGEYWDLLKKQVADYKTYRYSKKAELRKWYKNELHNLVFPLSGDGSLPFDRGKSGHGTHVAGILAKHLKNVDYCLIIVNYRHDYPLLFPTNLESEPMNLALEHVLSLDVDYVNISGGGIKRNNEESKIIKQLLDKGVTIVAAAGNEYSDLSIKPFYPALVDNRVVVVGSVDSRGHRVPSSNYGDEVDYTFNGKSIKSLKPNNKYGKLTGTSQATPAVLSKIVLGELEKK